jgi:hypothetical protein
MLTEMSKRREGSLVLELIVLYPEQVERDSIEVGFKFSTSGLQCALSLGQCTDPGTEALPLAALRAKSTILRISTGEIVPSDASTGVVGLERPSADLHDSVSIHIQLAEWLLDRQEFIGQGVQCGEEIVRNSMEKVFCCGEEGT